MSDPQSKLERLEAAGILERRQFTEDELALVATITDEEIDVLIRLRERLGQPEASKGHIKPNIIV
ncbi:MAG TPA: aroma-sacti cluster domain-containing protein [Candidatus Acidoferrales bacterium]|nr:aroma-sacti cluster domain-containing protein [Candidatus Acidoferrales bacterium]